MRRLRRSWKRWQFERGWRRIYGRDNLVTHKTDDQLRAEADLWERHGDPELAVYLREAAGDLRGA